MWNFSWRDERYPEQQLDSLEFRKSGSSVNWEVDPEVSANLERNQNPLLTMLLE